ncbi:DUF6263 family protein [Flammeovirga pacifica]|uniref:Uncharacterized protein n=1 Tax=Flammeovirga pacifica TaxID=915059 RepID=A0A1S1Z1K8_FLAPC|nr:DUF6263 family protein [Flammeovirga pacifica]OHX67117.1 hypothetical protein NH26_12575 [Flammeovirga pacifica]
MKQLLLFFILLSPISLWAQTSLKLQLKEGETYYQNSSNTTNIEQQMQGQTMKIGMDNISRTAYFVEKIADGNYQCKVTFESLEIGIEMGPQIQTFTSNSGEDPFSKILNALTKQSFSMILSPLGKVVAISGMEELWNNVEKATQDIPAFQKGQILNQLKQSYSNDQLISNTELVFSIYS